MQDKLESKSLFDVKPEIKKPEPAKPQETVSMDAERKKSAMSNLLKKYN